ncbi:MAG TPA: alkaline phosphatase family protein [Bryobacteraceae bacterium]|nr:alkaline phosphatase family protein [Bryobacteraceae bacterium]
MPNHKYWSTCALFTALCTIPAAYPQEQIGTGGISHVLLISIDGMHALDFQNCANGINTVNNGLPYCPNLATLLKDGVNYVSASTSKPSDSFPGLTAIVSGGSPRTTGVYYDVAYDRSLNPPAITTGNGVAGGPCTPGALPPGSTTEYEEGIDINQSLINGGAPGASLTDGGIKSIDPARLERDRNCNPVFPWNFVRTNTIFGVVHQAGGYTAWSDKHPAYASVSGPGNGTNLDDFYAPEINSVVVGLPNVTTPTGISCATIRDPGSDLTAWTNSFQNIQCYDTLKVNAILNEINGKTHLGNASAPVPAIFGMNFQAVSVGQKLIEANVGSGGYLDSAGTPSAFLLNEIQFVDASIGEWITALGKRGLRNSTMIVVTAKHGQSPIDPGKYFPIPGHSGTNGTSPANLLAALLPLSESPLNPTGIGPTEDDISLLWLADSTQTPSAAAMLEANLTATGAGEIFWGPAVGLMFNLPGLPPGLDPRTPDIVVTPDFGVVYTGSNKKQEEHGGFSHDDTNVMLLLSNPSLTAKTIASPVETAQVAPTILQILGLSPSSLQSVQVEGTQVLPGIK